MALKTVLALAAIMRLETLNVYCVVSTILIEIINYRKLKRINNNNHHQSYLVFSAFEDSGTIGVYYSDSSSFFLKVYLNSVYSDVSSFCGYFTALEDPGWIGVYCSEGPSNILACTSVTGLTM